jgi:anti-sigma B factor antagonist
MDKPRIKVSHKAGATIVELQDENLLELDEKTVNKITQSLFEVVQENAPVQMVLSFARVRYLGSCPMGALVRLSKRIAESGGTLKLCSVGPAVHGMFTLVKLDRIFDIYENEEMALDSFNS